MGLSMSKREERGSVEEKSSMELERALKVISNFPKQGVDFLDISPILADQKLFETLIGNLAQRCVRFDFHKIVAIESRGFILGSALAFHLGKSFIMVRKKGKLPGKTICQTYDLEYGTDSVEILSSSIQRGEKVLILDDVLATGGTAQASCELVESLGGCVQACLFFLELAFLKGRSRLPYTVESLVVRGG